MIGIGVDHTRQLTEVTGTISLSDGTVQFGGIVSQSPSFSLAVTGGTGSYTAATGTIDFRNTDNAQTLTVHVIEPAGAHS